MADLSKIKLNGTQYDMKDSEARNEITQLQNSKVNGAYTVVVSDTAPAAGTANTVITFVME